VSDWLLIDRIEDWLCHHKSSLFTEYMRLSMGVDTTGLDRRAQRIALDVIFSGEFDDCTGAEARELIATRLVDLLRMDSPDL
jgi:hypothetical protein